MVELHQPQHPVRLVTASALFDGHDASINIMRRIFMSQGAEVIHLGHNRSVQEVVDAALEEDVQGVAVSSYQGGHVEYFEYLVESLRAAGADHVKVVGGGGGVIVPAEIERLRESGVIIFSPEDGQRMGLVGMINSVVADCDFDLWEASPADIDAVLAGDRLAIARALTGAETGQLSDDMLARITQAAAAHSAPVLGITGTGGSGKSSLTDELVRRFRVDQQDKLRIAVIAVDPTRRRGGGALLGDRIRMNSLDGDRIFFRSPRHPRRPRAARAPRHRDRGDQGRRLRPRHRRDAGHRPGRRGDRAVRRPLALRHDAGVRRRLPAREDRHARLRRHRRDQQVRAPRRQGRAARRRPPAGPQPRGLRQAARRHAGLRHQRRHLQRRRRHRALPAPARHPRGRRAADRARAPSRASPYATPPASARSSRPIACATSPRSPRPSAATTRETDRLAEAARRVQRLDIVQGELVSNDKDTSGVEDLLESAQRQLPHEVADQIAKLARRRRVLLRRRAGREGPRQGDPHQADARVAVRQQDPPRRPPPVHRPRRAGEVLAQREPPRLLPLHRRRLPVQARRRGPGPDVRRRGRPVPHQPPLQDPQPRGRGHAPVDRLRLGDALRPRPRPAPRRLRQGRHLGCLRRDARRHEGAVRRLRPDRALDVGVADDQRPGADGAGLLPQHRHRPGRRTRHLRRRRPQAGARHGAGRHPQGGPGPEHRAVLHRVLAADDGRHPAVLHRQRGAELLLGLDLRLPHRRGRGEPDQPARLHAGQRLHLRRVLPRARHEHRRLRAQPVVLLLQRHGPGVQRPRSRRPPHLGGRR